MSGIWRRTDRLFGGLLLFEWLACIALAVWVSPKTWIGVQSLTHLHVWAAFILGGVVCSFPILLILRRPGHVFTRHAVAVAQMLMGVLLIHITGGRIESHFHVFGSLAFIAFYRDWRVLITASAIVTVDHLVRGIVWPQSVYGVLTASPWRTLEHAGWVVFEDIFLIISCLQSQAEVWNISRHRIELEQKNLEITAARDQALEARSLAESSSRQLAMEIQERKSANARLAQLLKEVESANQELNDFAYVVSHDLKAPLRAIGSLAGWIADDYADRLDDEGKGHLKLLQNRVKRMHDLIEGVLQYSRVGRVREKKEPADLALLVPEIVDMLSPPPNIDVQIESALPTVVVEKTRVAQVFHNLVSNSIKFLDKPIGEIKIGCTDAAEFWKFHVTDNGPGIEQRHFDKIFQIFQTLQARDELESTGIGLSVVKKAVEIHGGAVWVDSRVGIGSTFFFTLPKQNTKEIQPK